jgi:hypothetical protein
MIDKNIIRDKLCHEAAWMESHGATEDHLGSGILYYALPYLLRCRLNVCLGSGGGFVPRMMREAQRDLGFGRTVLIDANLPEAGWERPKWLHGDSFFRRMYPDIEIILKTTADAALIFEAGTIDYLHIDADHSYEAVMNDFKTYEPLLAPNALVTFHDTGYPDGVQFENIPGKVVEVGVGRALRSIRELGVYDVLDFPDIAAGTAIVRRRQLPGSTVFVMPYHVEEDGRKVRDAP